MKKLLNYYLNNVSRETNKRRTIMLEYIIYIILIILFIIAYAGGLNYERYWKKDFKITRGWH